MNEPIFTRRARILPLLLLSVPLLSACGREAVSPSDSIPTPGLDPSSRVESTTEPERTLLRPDARWTDAFPKTVQVLPRPMPSPNGAVAIDELVPIGLRTPTWPTDGAPSMNVSSDGRVHVAYVTQQSPLASTLGYLERDESWHDTPAITGASGSRGPLIDPDPTGEPVMYVWNEETNTTEMWARLRGAERQIWHISDTIELGRVYQPLWQGDALLGYLGDFGGNLYLIRQGPGGWEKDYFQRWGSLVSAPGIVMRDRGVAIYEGEQLTYFNGGFEQTQAPKPRYGQYFGPLASPEDKLVVLQSTGDQWNRKLMIVERAPNGQWTHRVIFEDETPPPPSACPDTLGTSCSFSIAQYVAAGMVLRGESEVPVVLRLTQEVSYERECLEYDTDFEGCVPACADEGGPSGPWMDQPRGERMEVAALIVGEEEIALSTPLTKEIRPSVAIDSEGDLHLAFYQPLVIPEGGGRVEFGVRYLRIPLK